MTIADFIASIDDCTESDLLNLSETLKATLPEHADMLKVAERQSPSARIRTLRFALKAVINLREDEERLSALPKRQRVRRTLEEQEEHALHCSQAILGHVSDAKWARLAEQSGKSPEEFRRNVWSKVFKTLRNFD